MNDLISRADAIRLIQKQIDNMTPTDDRLDDIARHCFKIAINLVSALPSAEAVQGWIPCSERLPSEDGRYLVTYPLFVRKNKWVNVLWYGKPSVPNINVKGKCWYRSDDEYGDVVYDDSEILAWMPLPEPYKGGEDA